MNELLQAWPIALALMGTGIFAGILAGLLGVGGGIVVVPVLYFIFQGFGVSAPSAMAIATATSLATIIPTGLSSTLAHHRKGNVDLEILKLWGVIILLASVGGSFVASRVSGDFLTWMFGIIAMLVSLNMLFRSNATALFDRLPGKLGQSMMASTLGGLSVMIGIGGGTIGVPLLSLFNVPVHRAVGTAAAFGLLIAVPGVVTLMLVGQEPGDALAGTWRMVNLPSFFLIIPLTVLFAPLGARLASALNPRQLKKAFAMVLFITGVRMLVQVSI